MLVYPGRLVVDVSHMSCACNAWFFSGIGWLVLNGLLLGCGGAEHKTDLGLSTPSAAESGEPVTTGVSRPVVTAGSERGGVTLMVGSASQAGASAPPAQNRQATAGEGGAPVAGTPGMGAEPVTVAMDAGTARDAAAPATDPEVVCPESSTLTSGDSNGTVDVSGVRRTYVAHVPSSYKGQTAVPLLIDMHGLFGNGQGQLRGSGTAAVADREGFIAVYPDGIDNAWNVGPCCTQDRGVDDMSFMRLLVEKLANEACIDRSRVYATGVSMGGGMAHYLACEAADVIAAVAPAAFDLLEENKCEPSRPIAVLSSRGTADSIVPYAGGASTPPNGVPTTIHFRGAIGTFEEWARIDGCTGSATPSYDGCESYTQCKGEVEVTLCTEQAGRHTYGDPNRSWEMLSKYRLP